MKKIILVGILGSVLLSGCGGDSKPEPTISETDKLAFKRCAGIVKGYASDPNKFEYYPSESTNFANAEGREVVTLSFAFGNSSYEKIYHKAECVITPDGKASMTQMLE